MTFLIRIFTSLFFTALITTTSQAKSVDIHAKTCEKLGGTMNNTFLCPSSGVLREGRFCVLEDLPSKPFFNGCTVSVAGYGDVFYKACVRHDFCYHHEPTTNNIQKANCDENFYNDMLNICDQRTTKRKRCFVMAYAFYLSVDQFGDKSWQCSDSYFDYDQLGI